MLYYIDVGGMREAPEIIESNMIACSYRFSWEQFVWAQRSVDAGAVRQEQTGEHKSP